MLRALTTDYPQGPHRLQTYESHKSVIMNILIIGNAYPPIYMGGESIQLYNLVTGLEKRGHRVFVFHPASSPDGQIKVELSRSGEKIDVYRILLTEKEDYLHRLNEIFLDIFGKLSRGGQKIDIIHCHSNRFSSSLDILIDRCAIPLVTTVHSIDVALIHDLIKKKGTSVDTKELLRYSEDTKRHRSLCARSDRIIAISKALISLIEKYLGAHTQKIRLVYDGIDFDRLAHFSNPKTLGEIKDRLSLESKTVILFAGRIEPLKGIQPLAAACKSLCERYEQIAFVFLGNGSVDAWLRSYLSSCRNVHFVDWLPFDKIIPYYHLADTMVLPTLVESFGLAAIEAMACGTCVVTSNADGLDEIITHEVNGVKIPLVLDEYGDRSIRAEDIYRVLEKAALRVDWRQSLAEQGLLRAKDFGLDKMIEGVEKVYSELIE